jgi:hypothetical protein
VLKTSSTRRPCVAASRNISYHCAAGPAPASFARSGEPLSVIGLARRKSSTAAPRKKRDA